MQRLILKRQLVATGVFAAMTVAARAAGRAKMALVAKRRRTAVFPME
ncbi:hypothetical protein LQ948_09825 [Jiella sp. MQZ9-1]|uniref:Uncharacterized protein n=1 Tax=Jiella flava TaxID=2816857 RepID=A0A939FX22_9HYPH|nr:hypothetical protein [Jiella flava]MBO0663087.1 hypothetical protein [Jiella flava]MCD2471506.1 hypothetical protein [Jiella flava]